MSQNQARLMRFVIRYPGWTSLQSDTLATARTLEAHGLIEIVRHGVGNYQMRLATEEA